METYVYDFWKRVDELRGQISLKELADMTGIRYSRIRDSRSLCRAPGIYDVVKISEALGVSMTYLVTGKDSLMLTPEMIFVRDNKTARLLIRKMMDNPALLEALSAVAALSVTPGETKEKNA